MTQQNHIIVSGGGSGVGAAIAQAFAKAGTQVTILGRTEEPLKAQGLHYALCDVTDAEAVKAVFERARAKHGLITSVIANAGAALSAPFARMESASLKTMFDVNVAGVFNCWQAALPDMKAAGGGR